MALFWESIRYPTRLESEAPMFELLFPTRGAEEGLSRWSVSVSDLWSTVAMEWRSNTNDWSTETSGHIWHTHHCKNRQYHYTPDVCSLRGGSVTWPDTGGTAWTGTTHERIRTALRAKATFTQQKWGYFHFTVPLLGDLGGKSSVCLDSTGGDIILPAVYDQSQPLSLSSWPSFQRFTCLSSSPWPGHRRRSRAHVLI